MSYCKKTRTNYVVVWAHPRERVLIEGDGHGKIALCEQGSFGRGMWGYEKVNTYYRDDPFVAQSRLKGVS